MFLEEFSLCLHVSSSFANMIVIAILILKKFLYNKVKIPIKN